MEARAIVRNVRMTPRKMKLICDLIRGKDAGTAMAIIMNTPKAASEVMAKLLKSAVANAENNHAEIVGRTLDIPVIMCNAKITNIIKDSAVITVDAEKGFVYDGLPDEK